MKRKFKMIVGIVMVMVLMSAFMVPFSAALHDNGIYGTQSYLYDSKEYRYEAFAWAYCDTTDSYATVSVFGPGGYLYGFDFDFGSGWDTAMASQYGPASYDEEYAFSFFHQGGSYCYCPDCP